MKFNGPEIKRFIKYYKYFIILRNVLSNYYKINIKNIKLVYMKLDIYTYEMNGSKLIAIKFVINNLLPVVIHLQIKPCIFAVNITNFTKYNYKFNYNLITNMSINIYKNYINYFDKKYYYLCFKILNNKKIILYKTFNLIDLNLVKYKYYYGLNNYKIYIIYQRFINNAYFDDITDSDKYKYYEYSYISKLLI